MTAYGNAANHPGEVPGLLIWLKADALALNNDDPVSTWTDSSGYGRDATGVTTARPLYKSAPAGFNGKPALLFDGVNDIMSFAALDLSLRTNVTVIAVMARVGADGSQQVIYEYSTNYGAVTDSFILLRSVDGEATVSLRGAQTNTTNSYARIGSTASIVTARFDTRLRRGEAAVAVDGDPQSYIVSYGGNNTNVFGNRTSFLGARSGGTLPFSGYIAEFLVYGRSLTARERKTVEDVLSTKYGTTRTVPTGVLATDGSSIGDGNGGDATVARVYLDYLKSTVSGTWEDINHCHAGTTIYDHIWDAGDLDRWLTPSYTKNVLLYGEGTNDEFHAPYASVATIQSRLTSYFADREAAGWTRVPWTLLPNNNAAWYGGGQAIFAADRPTINTWIRDNIATLGTVVADIGADTRIGEAGDENNTTYYLADASHLNTIGSGVAADIMATALASGGIAQRFAPTDLTGCVGWWDATQITSLVDNDPVGTWTNLATGIGNFTAAGSARPTYKTNIGARATKPVVRFDGTTDIMSTAAYDLSATTAVSVFVVFGNVTIGTEYVVLERSVNYGLNTGGFLLDRLAANTVIFAQKGNVGENNNTSGASVSTGYHVAAAVVDRSLAGASENIFTLNGVGAGQTGANNNTSHFGASDAFFLGGRSGGTFLIPGDICEVVIFNRALTIGERKRIELHLACKWSLF